MANAFRWLTFLPAAVVGAVISSSMMMMVGGALLGGWSLPSILILSVSAALVPVFGYSIGTEMAPVKSKTVSWIVAVPFLLFGALSCLSIIACLAGADPEEFFPFITGLSPKGQALSYYFGYVSGTAAMCSAIMEGEESQANRANKTERFSWDRWAEEVTK